MHDIGSASAPSMLTIPLLHVAQLLIGYAPVRFCVKFLTTFLTAAAYCLPVLGGTVALPVSYELVAPVDSSGKTGTLGNFFLLD